MSDFLRSISHFWHSREHFFIDFEASGLDPTSYPIEIGIVGCDGSRFETLIKPAKHWNYWSRDAEDIHGIIRERLQDGMGVLKLAKQLNERYAGKTLWADSGYDRFWMGVLFAEAGLEPAFTLGNLYNQLPASQIDVFQQHIKRPVAHRALQDAFDIRTAWFEYLKPTSAA